MGVVGGLTREALDRLLGPAAASAELGLVVESTVDCGRYRRDLVSYAVSPGVRVSAFVCVPTHANGPLPGVFCHHQLASQFHWGKSEPVGLAGDPEMAFAAELADRGWVTITPDAIGFECWGLASLDPRHPGRSRRLVCRGCPSQDGSATWWEALRRRLAKRS